MTTNPWFAQAFVNRMWGHFLGRGFVDPVDDMRPSNPPQAPELLDALAADFVAHDYDLKHLIRTIALSQAYGLAAAPARRSDPENKLWSTLPLAPLGPEELLNAVFDATDLETRSRRLGRFNVEEITARLRQLYGFLFDVDEEADDPTTRAPSRRRSPAERAPRRAAARRRSRGARSRTLARAETTDAQRSRRSTCARSRASRRRDGAGLVDEVPRESAAAHARRRPPKTQNKADPLARAAEQDPRAARSEGRGARGRDVDAPQLERVRLQPLRPTDAPSTTARDLRRRGFPRRAPLASSARRAPPLACRTRKAKASSSSG